MEFTAQMIAQFLNGEIEGNPDIVVNNVSKIEEGKPGTLAFLANPKYNSYLYNTQASIVLINKSFELEKPVSTTLIRVEDAYKAFASLMQMVDQSKPVKSGVSSSVSIHESAMLGENNYIGDFAVIGENVVVGNNCKIYPHVYLGDNVVIGDNTIIFSGVKVYHECRIGSNCILHANTVIGSDGFGFAKSADGSYEKIPQLGNVILEDNVEIGANSCIDRAVMDSTILRKGVKLDNLVQIAHNVDIGRNTVIAAQTGIAGSTKIGEECIFGGQVGIIGHLKVGNRVSMGAKTGCARNTKDDVVLLGNWGTEASKERRAIAAYRNLPELVARVNELERKLKELEK